MPRKKNPEEEVPPMEQPEAEPPVEEPEAPEEEPTQEPDEEAEAPEDAEETKEETEEGPEEEPSEEPTEEEPVTDQTEALRNQLLQVQGELAAYRAGVAPNMVADAVTLAMAEAAKAGAVTEASVAAAMEAVLKRHPEWKASEGGRQKGGFRIGADRDNGGTPRKNDAPQNVKRWNRFK